MSKTLLIMAAGTGGHVMPGLAVAAEMQARGWQVHWLGTTHGMENRLVPAKGIRMTRLNFSGLRGKGWQHSLAGVFKLVLATWQSWRLMRKLKPAVVLGMGGYVTVPGGWAARACQLPLALVNADARLLMSNRALLSAAQRVLFGFQTNTQEVGADKLRVTGNPVRTEIVDIIAPEHRYGARQGALRLLVVGGSLGAQVLNELVPQALALMPEAERPQVVHQAGERHIQQLRAAYTAAGVTADVRSFIEDMAAEYAAADVLVCRAGAITISEITVAGVASVLVPLLVSTTSHQQDNARWLAEQGAALHLPQQALTAESLAVQLRALRRPHLLQMAQQARHLGRPNATSAIADQLEEIALP
ncbi:undecaprenyldiphospho-muramoylpentapeptide beta-N-acetylglucosaminyltransferase [Pseudomethylobacillus aquaticus]|uniref:UDP-N-acetylglucosamine--N-acetylmuramyl-(pentapeptide) pyrophosphoryl-undecaprenol N-acetylglucosamine transferase n=1 Tax=Pseudomethylobacillus aquaticus TaxID=2676064 RepID=A0A3N0UUF2_9PROT|nr:undecaprenyldiphospho-muramoylpentapeptide beta-N-acetylglucosaminyltransferase [Pseudomethylobacillus aquaticus]ROH84122.1 undecaprenyldiphospho-muramoylpentapeptide beta-N-acetylglucosaminyltransferase [Pseudomethylobacillus aquaticus]